MHTICLLANFHEKGYRGWKQGGTHKQTHRHTHMRMHTHRHTHGHTHTPLTLEAMVMVQPTSVGTLVHKTPTAGFNSGK